ncbi:PAS domain-containing response regulator [Halorubrum luteum]
MRTSDRRSSSEVVEKRRILHVDDDPAFVDLTTAYLDRIDGSIDVTSETSASAALEQLADERFDCVVSDYDMPEMNGLEFLERVRDRDVDVPFVLFTGKGSEEIASEAISAGATDYIQKEPGSDQFTVLANRVRNAIDQHRSKRALAASQERLSRFIDQSPLGTIEYDDRFRIVRVNAAAESILGYDASELVGGTWMPIVPDDEARTVAEVERQLLDNKGGFRSVNENVRADGERIRCSWHNQVVTDDAGDVITIFSQFEDITDREARKRELERTNAVLSTVFDSLSAGVLAEDADRCVLTMNQQLYEMLDLEGSPSEAVGRDCERFAVEVSQLFADPDGFVERINEVVAAREPVTNERIELADGKRLRRTYHPIDLPDGEGHLWVYQHVTSDAV